MAGRFIVLEGGDGVGKTTHVALLSACPADHAQRVVAPRASLAAHQLASIRTLRARPAATAAAGRCGGRHGGAQH